MEKLKALLSIIRNNILVIITLLIGIFAPNYVLIIFSALLVFFVLVSVLGWDYKILSKEFIYEIVNDNDTEYLTQTKTINSKVRNVSMIRRLNLKNKVINYFTKVDNK